MYLGDFVGLSTTKDLNWWSWGAREVGVTGALPLVRRDSLVLSLCSGSVCCVNSLAESLYRRLTMSVPELESTSEVRFSRALFSGTVRCANSLAERLRTLLAGDFPECNNLT